MRLWTLKNLNWFPFQNIMSCWNRMIYVLLCWIRITHVVQPLAQYEITRADYNKDLTAFSQQHTHWTLNTEHWSIWHFGPVASCSYPTISQCVALGLPPLVAPFASLPLGVCHVDSRLIYALFVLLFVFVVCLFRCFCYCVSLFVALNEVNVWFIARL